MKITGVKALSLAAPLSKKLSTSAQTFTEAKSALVRLTTSDGIEGVGECLARYSPLVWSELVEEVLAPLIVGADPFDVEWIWNRMYRGLGSFSGHSRGILLEAMSGIDIAVWDVMGKSAGMPVHKLLGGSARSSIAAYASSVGVAELAAMVEDATTLVERGFTAIKVKIGLGAEQDATTIWALRKAVGPTVEIMVDANCAYQYPEAARLARRLEEVPVAWFEEPFSTEDLASYSMLRQNSIVPLAAGEGEFTRFGIKALLDTGAVNVVQPDVARAGGISECHKIAITASLYNASFSPHVGNCGGVAAAASVQLAAAAGNFNTYECSYYPHPLRDELLLEPVGHASQIKNGELPVPDRPGLGVELNEEVVERYTMR
ncbi:MAG: mandelate racemase/muconate lactonizing enzyme family protein [Trueperaceae bacterium]